MPAPTTWSDDNAIGTLAWNNPGNAEVQDDTDASATIASGSAAVTHYLKGLNPGLSETLPPRQVIATVRRDSFVTGVNRARDHTVKLVVGGVVTGPNKAAADDWIGIYQSITYTWDIPADLSLTAVQVNASDFGIVFAVQGIGLSGSVFPGVDYVNLTALPAMLHLTNADYLGRLQLGDKLPLHLTTVNNTATPTVPDAAPYADIYAGATLVETVRLPPLERLKQTGIFGLKIMLGTKYSEGQHMVVYRYLLSAVKYQRFAYFQILPGGNALGPALALREYRKPTGRHIVQQREGGRLQYGQNPTV